MRLGYYGNGAGGVIVQAPFAVGGWIEYPAGQVTHSPIPAAPQVLQVLSQ